MESRNKKKKDKRTLYKAALCQSTLLPIRVKVEVIRQIIRANYQINMIPLENEKHHFTLFMSSPFPHLDVSIYTHGPNTDQAIHPPLYAYQSIYIDLNAVRNLLIRYRDQFLVRAEDQSDWNMFFDVPVLTLISVPRFPTEGNLAVETRSAQAMYL